MKKQSDRIRDWRERQKADGKTSITVLLSQEAREILTREKEKTGESYSVIVEKALQSLKKQDYRLPSHKRFNRDEFLARVAVKEQQLPAPAPVSADCASEGQSKVLIDDLANYPSFKDLETEQILKKETGGYDFKPRKGLINRLFRSSSGSLGRMKDAKLIRKI